MADDSSLRFLVGRRIESFTRNEYEWWLMFNEKQYLAIACLWRLIHMGRIRGTSADDGQWFGLPAPVDAAQEVNNRIAGELIESVKLQEGTLDIEFRFDNGYSVEVIPDSAGYEA